MWTVLGSARNTNWLAHNFLLRDHDELIGLRNTLCLTSTLGCNKKETDFQYENNTLGITFSTNYTLVIKTIGSFNYS